MEWLYAGTFLLYGLVWVSSRFGLRWLPYLIAAAVTLNGGTLGLIYLRSGHVPVFNLFESLLLISLILGGLDLIQRIWGREEYSTGGWLWLLTVLLLGILWFFPKGPAPFRYDSDDPYIVLFHAMRNVSLAFVLFASLHFVRVFGAKGTNARGDLHLHQGRNYLLLGAVCFLVSEFAGILWCLNGWGDVWRWGANFFQSTLIMLYLMLAFHVPGKSRRADRVRSLVGGMGGVFILALTIVRAMP